MSEYAEDPKWEDITPIPQDDGGPNPLAAIAYTEEYSEAMSYLRAVMARNEMSERALELTEHIIDMNAAHYTVWLYRARILLAINYDLQKELEWLNETALTHQKNYQVWHHRQFVIDNLGSAHGERAFMAQMFAQDSKNYHVWSYRQWLVRRYDLWEPNDEVDELKDMETLLEEDVRNNSAWNHRFFLVNGREGCAGVSDPVTLHRELDFAKAAVRKAPQNQSPWNYMRGCCKRAGVPLAELRGFAEEFALVERSEEVRSSHALDLLADVYAQEGERERAELAYDLLATQYDPIRANYWRYLKDRVGATNGTPGAPATAAAA